MKAYKEFLAESKKVYQFRVKIADSDVKGEIIDRMERGLDQFDLADISKPKRLPVSRCREFASLGPVERHVIDVSLNYPATSVGVRQAVSSCTGIPLSHIVVVTTLEDEMVQDPTSVPEEGVLLTKTEMASDPEGQNNVGFKRVESLLKELSKTKHGGDQYTGVNDNILAKSTHAEKAAKTTTDSPQGKVSAVGSNKNKLQGPKGK